MNKNITNIAISALLSVPINVFPVAEASMPNQVINCYYRITEVWQGTCYEKEFAGNHSSNFHTSNGHVIRIRDANHNLCGSYYTPVLVDGDSGCLSDDIMHHEVFKINETFTFGWTYIRW